MKSKRKRHIQKVKNLSEQAYLIDEIIKKLGGLTKAVKFLNSLNSSKTYIVQDFSNWRARSGVPIEHCYFVSSALGINPFALNYKDLSKTFLFKKEIPTWGEAVESCRKLLGSGVVDRILKKKGGV